jgi:hypothetical protein
VPVRGDRKSISGFVDFRFCGINIPKTKQQPSKVMAAEIENGDQAIAAQEATPLNAYLHCT